MIYPFSDRIHDEDTWAAGSSNYDGHIEYWRFYQSSQFLYLGAIREETDRALKDALQGRWNSRANRSSNGDAVSRFLGLTNTVYNITEYFELASRLAQARIYREPVTISISLKDVAGFGLVADLDWRMMNEYVSQETQLDYPVTLTPADLVSSSAKHAMKCILWLYKKFGWANPNIDAIRTDQERLLSQRT
jgi:hypothetical protein